MRRLLVMTVLALTLGAAPASAILNGQPDGSAHPYVGMATQPGSLCSGSKISEHRFLTAGHCFVPGSQVSIVFDENGAAPTVTYTGTFTRSGTSDVGIVQVSGGMPPPYAALAEPGAVDSLPMRQEVTSVGYGLRERPKDFAGEFKRRYRATSELIQDSSSSSPHYVKLSANPAGDKGGVCFGDSGGPALLGDTILAITAGGSNSNCAGVTYSQRVDLLHVRSFIDAFAP